MTLGKSIIKHHLLHAMGIATKGFSPLLLCVCMLMFSGSICVLAGTSQADLQHNVDWVTVETRHFVIIAENALRDNLEGLALDCEQAYAELSPLFQWRFQEKVTVLFSDRTDHHNGWATALPRATMFIAAAPPRAGSFLSDLTEHRRRTVYHEMAHLLQIDAHYGFIRDFNAVFGRIIPDMMDPLSLLMALACLPPANAAPTWYLEGTAVWAETRFVGPGRGRNADVDAVFRTAVEQNRLLPSYRWHLREPDWPYGNTPYLYGMKAIQEAASGKPGPGGSEVPGRLGQAVARAPVAGFFNSQALDVLNRDFDTVTNDAWSHEVSFQKSRIATLKSRPLTSMERWSPLKTQVSAPVWTRNGELWVVATYEDQKSRLSRVQVNSRTISPEGPRVTPGWTQTAADPDTGQIFFTRLDGIDGNTERSHLYQYDPGQGKTQRIRSLNRVMDVGVGPEGMVAIVRRDLDGDVLEVYRRDRAEEATLLALSKLHRTNGNDTLASPVFSARGDMVYCLLLQPGQSRIMSWNPVTGQPAETLWVTDQQIRSLELSTSGNLIFCGDLNGVFNVYRFNTTSRLPEPLTNTIGGVTASRFSADERTLAAVGMDADGYFVTLIPKEDLLQGTESLITLDSPWRLSGEPSKRWDDLPGITPLRAYHPLKHLDFNYWTPWLNAGPGYWSGGVATRWSDRTFSHRLFAYTGIDSDRKKVFGAVQWQYVKPRPGWSVYLALKNPVYSGLIQDVQGRWFDYEETLLNLNVSSSWEWVNVHYAATLETGWQFLDRSGEDASLWRDAVDRGRMVNAPLIEGQESSLWAAASIGTATAYPRSLSLDDGWYLKGSADWSDNLMGSDLDRFRLRAETGVWIGVPGLKHHVMKVSAVYGTGFGDNPAQGSFTVSGYDDLGPGNPPGMQSAMILRGYPANVQTGDRAAAMGLSYRFPVWQEFRSITSRSILYVTQVMGEVFWETAAAWDSDRDDARNWMRSFGAEAHLGTVWFNAIDLAPGIGVCRMPEYFEKNALNPGQTGDWSVYFSLKATINH